MPERVVADGKQQDVLKELVVAEPEENFEDKSGISATGDTAKNQSRKKTEDPGQKSEKSSNCDREETIARSPRQQEHNTSAKKPPGKKKRRYAMRNHTNWKTVKVKKQDGASRGWKKRSKFYTPGARFQRAPLEPVWEILREKLVMNQKVVAKNLQKKKWTKK